MGVKMFTFSILKKLMLLEENNFKKSFVSSFLTSILIPQFPKPSMPLKIASSKLLNLWIIIYYLQIHT